MSGFLCWMVGEGDGGGATYACEGPVIKTTGSSMAIADSNLRAIGLHRANARANHRPASNCPASAEPLRILCRLESMLVDPKGPNPGFERLPRNAQPYCCSGRTGYSPLRGCQGGLDPLSLVSGSCAGG